MRDDRILCKTDCSRLIQSTGVCAAAAAGLMPGFARTYQPPDRPLRCYWFLGHHQGLLLNADTGAARWPLLNPVELARETAKAKARSEAQQVEYKAKRKKNQNGVAERVSASIGLCTTESTNKKEPPREAAKGARGR